MKLSYLKQDNVTPHPTQHNTILFELDFNVKLCLLQFLSDFKSTIFSSVENGMLIKKCDALVEYLEEPLRTVASL